LSDDVTGKFSIFDRIAIFIIFRTFSVEKGEKVDGDEGEIGGGKNKSESSIENVRKVFVRRFFLLGRTAVAKLVKILALKTLN